MVELCRRKWVWRGRPRKGLSRAKTAAGSRARMPQSRIPRGARRPDGAPGGSRRQTRQIFMNRLSASAPPTTPPYPGSRHVRRAVCISRRAITQNLVGIRRIGRRRLAPCRAAMHKPVKTGPALCPGFGLSGRATTGVRRSHKIHFSTVKLAAVNPWAQNWR